MGCCIGVELRVVWRAALLGRDTSRQLKGAAGHFVVVEVGVNSAERLLFLRHVGMDSPPLKPNLGGLCRRCGHVLYLLLHHRAYVVGCVVMWAASTHPAPRGFTCNC